MTREQHLQLLEEKMKRNLDIARKKNNDYCGQNEDSDPFHNFRASEHFGVPVEKGILVRMSDKMSRIGTLLNQEARVADESIQDALADLSNYALILSNFLDSQKENKTPDSTPIFKGHFVRCIVPESAFAEMIGRVEEYSENTDEYVVRFGTKSEGTTLRGIFRANEIEKL